MRKIIDLNRTSGKEQWFFVIKVIKCGSETIVMPLAIPTIDLE